MLTTHHLCLSLAELRANPELLSLVRGAGITDIWFAGFMYGYWLDALPELQSWRARIERAGMAAHIVNIPLGHPGDSLGARDGEVPLSPPTHWQMGTRPDGTWYSGTSLHAPATLENCTALRELQAIGVKQVFLDDDFRLAPFPGLIGGCFCAQHREEFLRRYGYQDAQWPELLDAVARRKRTALLRHWCDFTCDALTASFREQQQAAPELRLGIMVMYLGAEKAGIRLNDYADTPLRVGESMFNDASFAPVKAKTDELFSVLFHRRFVRPELAFSETTAFPADQLSAGNMVAKLTIPLLSDVRHTMFMSGLTTFPTEHWQVLAPAMAKQQTLQTRIAGHRPAGPLKHYWGEASRLLGDDAPFSLFLALGIPFEVTATPAPDGWTFLSDFDARDAVDGILTSPGTRFIARPERIADARSFTPAGDSVAETLPALFTWKDRLLPQLLDVPLLLDEKPVVCAWYPTARAVLVWNLSAQAETLTLRYRQQMIPVPIAGLGVEMVTV